MNNKILQYLELNQIKLDKSFITLLKEYAIIYKKKNNKNLNDVWLELGVNKQKISYYAYNQRALSTRRNNTKITSRSFSQTKQYH